ncbi:uncharacterized protein UBRO_06592 [Ustilago bromivora]|uniref:Uncharacterized protein n=1 Tax=Ustilago bromivora TaxID=307758 RepID=A0A1K0HAD5_9BASI|nr:uncharacterized protein UBRO_06592 [Ustilago bromivora]SYW73782.1 uncharacterized protein UBRO2_00057 [Ustilago bromivora]
MAPRHTRIVSLLLLLAIYAVGVLSAGASSSRGSDYVPEVHKQMFDTAEIDQTQALKDQGHTYLSRGRGDYSHIHSFDNRALVLAKQRGVKYVGTSGQELYFYSIIQPHTELGKAMGFRPRLGKHGYVSVLWEHNKNWKNPSMIDASEASHVTGVQDHSFIWQMEPFEKVLERVPK